MIVKCPTCKTKYVRDSAAEELCGVCLTKNTFTEVAEKKKKKVQPKKK